MDQEDWAEDFRAVLLCPVPGLYGTCLRLYRAQVLPRSCLCPDTSPLLRLCSYVVCIFRSVPIKCTCICEVRGQLQAYFRSQLQLFFWLVGFVLLCEMDRFPGFVCFCFFSRNLPVWSVCWPVSFRVFLSPGFLFGFRGFELLASFLCNKHFAEKSPLSCLTSARSFTGAVSEVPTTIDQTPGWWFFGTDVSLLKDISACLASSAEKGL